MKIILPMAGYGTRLRPHTWSVPKPLVPLAGKAMIDHIFDRLLPLKPEEIICIVGYLGDQIEGHVQRHYAVATRFVEQPEMRGQADAIARTRDLVDGDALIIFADTIFEADFTPLRTLRDHGIDGAIYVKEVDDPRRFGVAVLDDKEIAVRLVEKPEEPVSNLALAGLYYFTDMAPLYDAIDTLVGSGKALKGEYYLADAIQIMIARGARLQALTIPVWEDCGKPAELLHTNRYLLSKMEQDGQLPNSRTLPDSIVIQPSWVDPTAAVTRSVIGPYVSVGAGAKLTGVVIEDSIVGEDADLAHMTLASSILSTGAMIEGMVQRFNLGAGSSAERGTRK
ncbi:MAG: sugar phosphate nucleotidyltransferase [Thermomicrobiales bacterium]